MRLKMKTTKLDRRFFDSTRGRIVNLLRGTSSTVERLAQELELTNNAVRAHLLTLERDGIVRQSGVHRGFRKPHYIYELTTEAEHLFPKSYDALFNKLLDVLKQRLAPQVLRNVLREVGRGAAGNYLAGRQKKTDLEKRVRDALKALEELGGAAQMAKEGSKFYIRSNSCPLAAVVASHPEACKLAETLIAEIVEAPVKERCNREHSPQCCFEIAEAK